MGKCTCECSCGFGSLEKALRDRRTLVALVVVSAFGVVVSLFPVVWWGVVIFAVSVVCVVKELWKNKARLALAREVVSSKPAPSQLQASSKPAPSQLQVDPNFGAGCAQGATFVVGMWVR